MKSDVSSFPSETSLVLTPPAQAADITGLLSYLRPFGIDPLPPFPSKIFAPLSLLRSFPP